MKVTDRIADLVIKLGRHEPFERVDGLIAGDEISLVNVLRMFHQTNNEVSRGLLTEILSDVGYDWFERDATLIPSEANTSAYPSGAILLSSERFSPAEFMKLGAPNSYLH